MLRIFRGRLRRLSRSKARRMMQRSAPTILALALVAALIPSGASGSSAQKPGGGQTGSERITRHSQTGLTRFIGTAPGRPIPRPTGVSATSRPQDVARSFLDTYAARFGVVDHVQELRVSSVDRGLGERSTVRFQQLRRGVPVLGGELVVNLDRNGNLLSTAGEALPREPVTVAPNVRPAAARRAARGAIAKSYGVQPADLATTAPKLWIYDSRILGGPGLGKPILVWLTEVRDRGAEPINELVLVDARLGSVALHFSQIHAAKDREVCDANSTATQVPCVTPVRTEGGPVHAVSDVNDAYDFAGDTYDFFFGLGRDSLDNAGMTLTSTVRYCPTVANCPYQNAFWDGEQMVYGAGFAAADDVVGHELAHGVTDFSSHLFYYYQSGAINESMSDVFGEFVDLTNGAGNDDPSVRWLLGEDIPGIGAIRDMENPPAFGDPDRMTSPNYTADPDELDGGGVHTNSGVNNKAAFLITDGGTFNGETVTGLGITKASMIYYRVEVAYLTSASDYADLYNALQQACSDLVGTGGITVADCAEVTDAVNATEMDVSPPAAPNPEAPVCPAGQTVSDLFFDDLENTASGNWATETADPPGAWYYPQNSNPFGFDATYATSGDTNFWGYNVNSVSDYRIAMASDVAIPAGSVPYLRFAHAHGFEDDGGGAYDGGVLEYSTNSGSSWSDAGALATNNGYNGTIFTGFGNPLSGRSAFVRESNGYISSRFDLSSLAGQNVRFRFRIGTDSLVDDLGWFVDDVRIYTCSSGPNDPPVADAGGPYTITEGNALTLNGSGSTDPDGDPLTYGWDLDGDLDYNDATGQSPVVSWATLTTLGLVDGPDNATVGLRVTDTAANSDTDSIGLTLQNAAPTAAISGPAAAATGVSTTWTFSATDPSPIDQAGTFTYEIDWDGDGTVDQTVTGDSSEPVAHTYPADATVTIRATAEDKDGGTSAEATRSVTVSTGGGGGGGDTTPPETTITSGPSGLTNDPTATFEFSSSEAGSTFECRVDSDPFAGCLSPFTTDSLLDGAHVFDVRATDGAGNLDVSPASRSFNVDTAAPEATITKKPKKKTKNRRPAFSFASDETGVSFDCRIDKRAWQSCSSPFRPSKKLSFGWHVFKLRATDAAGNVAQPAAKYRFKVIRRK